MADTALYKALVKHLITQGVGGQKLGGFKHMREAILRGDYPGASKEMMNSSYAKQVKTRAVRNSDLMAGRTMARFKQESK